ncbi:MAG: hypothetical protein IM568_12310 [Flavobacterium sp.]|jgi:hypothetical protein|nr:hypothetical protein [Flavobacterium sp.]
MKKIILSLAFVALLASCQDKTKEKLDEAKEAITKELTTSIDSAKIKAEAKLDTLKDKANSKVDSIKLRSAEKIEEAAKKLKESVNK